MCEAFGEVVGGEEKWIVDCCAHPALVQKQFLKPPSNRGTRGTPAWPDGPGLAPKLLSNPLHDEKVLRVKLYQAVARTNCISSFLAAGFNGILNCRSSLALHSAAPVGEASDGTAPSTYIRVPRCALLFLLPTKMPETALLVPYKMLPSSFASMSGRAGTRLSSLGSFSAPKITSGWEGPEPRARIRTSANTRSFASVRASLSHSRRLDGRAQ